MGQASSKFRRGVTAYFWFCPACNEMHPLPLSWKFNGDLTSPTFEPSFKHTWNRFHEYDERGVGIGEPFAVVCHYVMTAGRVAYCGDCTHAMKNQTVDVPDLPAEYTDAHLSNHED